MTALAEPPAPLPRWLVDAVMGLVASAYEAGRSSVAPTETPAVEHDLLDRVEAAAALRCSKGKLDKLIGSGALNSVMVGGRRLVPREAIAEYLHVVAANPLDPGLPRGPIRHLSAPADG